MARAFVLHENPLWLPPLAQAFDHQGLPWTELHLDVGTFDMSAPPPEGIFYNRMSGSSHMRNHRYSVELTFCVLAWLTKWGRTVVNSQNALDMEISKVRQYAELERLGIKTPRTVFLSGRDQIVSAAKKYFDGQPFILKPNRGGKGGGVQLFKTIESLAQYVESDQYETPVGGVELLQAYIHAPRSVITRAEFVNGRFLYALEVDTSDLFKQCPLEITRENKREKFKIVDGIPEQLRTQLESFLAVTGISIAGIEFVTDVNGNSFVYDVNTNTNYNAEAEEQAGLAGTVRSGPGAVAAYLSAELSRLYNI
ncbi:uncharacterized protein LOC119066239 [Bradysia coprophila]|uniref:uncharacterized protein LOC119066239 n=1 Tax=Bradysia coprophila TaxID=38358 RepID=UPI00187D95DB|nr:uncharacterized protein LOC119066239 [Bradysia coprophila]